MTCWHIICAEGFRTTSGNSSGSKAIKNGRKRTVNESKAGNFIMVGTRETDPKEAYRMYKSRCEAENFFDSAKNVLSTDKMHICDDAHIMGFLFVTFVAVLIRSGLIPYARGCPGYVLGDKDGRWKG